MFRVKWGVLWFMFLSGLRVYRLIMAGWSSNSKYSMLGAIRGVAQVISYEIRMGLILFFPVILGLRFNLYNVLERQQWV